VSQVRERGAESVDRHAVERDRRLSDQQVRELIKDVTKDRVRASELARVDVKELSPQVQQMLAQLVVRELKGQLPFHLAQALLSGQAGTDLLASLTGRLANASGGEREQFGKASSPEAARALASDSSTPQHALRWSQFVQRVQNAHNTTLQDRAGSAAPKGEGTALAELLAQRGPSLRNPKLVERGLSELAPQHRDMLLRAAVGDVFAQKLKDAGILDPLMLVQAGATPEGRAALAELLGLDRGQLLSLLLKTELLKIGPGQNGELGIRPDLLAALKAAGITMLGTLGALRGLDAEELKLIYKLLRENAQGFGKTLKGLRPPLKRDLLHWARAASRKDSEILLADLAERKGGLTRGDARELLQAWYLENLFWETLASARKQADDRANSERAKRRVEEQDAQDGRERDRRQEQDKQQESEPAWDYDHERQDRLMCFWITDHNTDPSSPMATRRMYVCIDPDTGAILPQQIEAELHPSSGKKPLPAGPGKVLR
jgi:hypothetical protein